MTYCTASNVAAEFKGVTFTTSTTPALSSVEEFIEQESNYIDGYVSGRYETPVDESSSPKAYSILKRICTFLVVDRVRQILKVKTGSDKLDQEARGRIKDAKKDVLAIVSSELKLTDASLATSHDGFADFNSSNDIEPVFDVTKQQW